MTTIDGFDHIRSWVFDLDNTLYPSESNLFAQIDQRMSAFVSEFLNLELEEARRIQKQYYYDHGTTLSGLMKLHNLAPEEFLDYVHDIDLSPVPENPDLVTALDRLPGRKMIFTNGSHQHAINVLEHLSILDHFDDIVDIAASKYIPKSQAEAFDIFVEIAAVDPEAAVMFDDLQGNLKPAKDLGMKTVWLNSGPDWSHDKSGTAKSPPDHVDHTTDDLALFLNRLNLSAPISS